MKTEGLPEKGLRTGRRQANLAGIGCAEVDRFCSHGERNSTLSAISLAPAYAGAPFVTDDPVPVDYEHFQLFTFTMGAAVSGDTSGVGPAWEYNYGIIPNGQFHIVAPIAFDSPSGEPTRSHVTGSCSL